VETETYREGGVNDFVHHLPRQTTHANLVLKHGLTAVSALWNWYYNVTQGVIERKNGAIMLLDNQLTPLVWWNFRNAFPVKWAGPSFNAADTAIAFETIELVHEGMTKPLLAQGVSLGRSMAGLAGSEGG
jgi:phage tail-like protein